MVYEVSRKPPTHQHTHTHTMSFGSSYETQENLAEWQLEEFLISPVMTGHVSSLVILLNMIHGHDT